MRSRLPPLCVPCIGWSDSTLRWLPTSDLPDRAMAAGQRSRDQAAQALATSPEPVSPGLLRRTIDAARAEGPLDRELSRAQRALAEAEDIVAAALAALPLWRSDLETLLVCPLPLQAETEAVASTFEAARDRLAAVREDVGNLTAEIADLENEVSRFTRGETVPTPDAVTAGASGT